MNTKLFFVISLLLIASRASWAQNALDRLGSKNNALNLIENYKPVKLSFSVKGDSIQYKRRCFLSNSSDSTIILTIKLPYGYYQNCSSGTENFVTEGYVAKTIKIKAKNEISFDIYATVLGRDLINKKCGGVGDILYERIVTI